MDKIPLRILQVSKADLGGGAEKIAWDLFQDFRARGLESWLAVGSKRSDDPDVLLVPLESNSNGTRWSHGWLTVANRFSTLVKRVRGAWKVRNVLRMIAQPGLLLETQRGHEDFEFQGSWHVLDLLAKRPNILHCHNLHGGYFDLRALPSLSHEVPTILTMHDAWLLSGHCAHSFDCEKWKTGCGLCPDLSIYPAIKRDATVYNWRRKKTIYASSRLYVSTPSEWLMRKVGQSILAAGIVEARVIPNGVDLAVFHPEDKNKARTELGIPQDARILLFVGNTTQSNLWKDYATLESAFKQVIEHLPTERIILICLGEERSAQRIGRAEVQFVGFQNQSEVVARFYQAADVYVHASKVDTFPNTVLEALACGTPVVATNVGGIPEQIKNGETGFLVPPKDVDAMTASIMTLLTDDGLRRKFSIAAAQDVRERFDLAHQVNAYIDWYRAIDERTHQKERLEI